MHWLTLSSFAWGGANIDIIKIAARTNAGDPIALQASDGYFELVSMGEVYLELEYRAIFSL